MTMRTLILYFPLFLLGIALLLGASPQAFGNNFSRITWESLPGAIRFSIATETPMVYVVKDRLDQEGYIAIDVLGITKTYEDRALDLGDARLPRVLIQDHPTENRVGFLFYPAAGIKWKVQPGNNPQEMFIEFYAQSPTVIQKASSSITDRKGGEDASQENNPQSSEEKIRKLIIIDPGHGGFNKGARSYRKIKGKYYWEKDLVLQYAQKLKQLINQSPNMAALLTRSTDDYVSLTDRVEFAQNNEGDLFLSIHLNDSANPGSKTARGIEIFHWKETGSNNAADQYLEKLENDQMLPKLSQTQDAQLKRILAGMLKDALEEEKIKSARLCDVMWDSFSKSSYFAKYHRTPPVKSARFVVLANYAMPSVLVEVGFLSSYDEASNLVSESFQWTSARCMYNGIQAFLGEEDPNFKPHYIQY